MRIGIIAAIPGELKPLVRGWERLPVVRGSGIRVWRKSSGEDEAIAACAGMGAAAGLRAFAAVEFLGSLDGVLSIGWAGALTESAETSLVLSEVIDAQTGERFTLTDGKRRLRVVSSPRVADAAEKRRLAATYGAVAVDMEGATVARLAEMRGIPMCCFKAISDGVDAKLPDFNLFIDANGQMKMAAFLAHVAMRPKYWASLMELGRQSARASKKLAELTERFLIGKDFARVNRTGVIE